MRKKNLAPRRQIRKLERERARIVEGLLAREPLIRGSLSLVKRTCGNKTCHCAKKPAHEAWVLMSTLEGERRCQVVRQEDVEEVRGRVEIYRAFRAALRRLKAIETEQNALLRGILERRAELYE